MARAMNRPLWKSAGYQFFKTLFWLIAKLCFWFRWRGAEHIPRGGGALICSNHQSYFDPVLVGICFRRQINFVARDTLLSVPLFGPLIRYLEAIPIDREGLSISGIKETLRRLKRGEMVLIFPEGTRTLDGHLGALKPGFCALARRARVPILPVAVDGAYDAWPRSRRFPRATRLRTCFGPVIEFEQIEQLSDEQLIEEVHRRIEACWLAARRFRGLGPPDRARVAQAANDDAGG
jgi:1-acyl-sn-glycerol-3-phosphate acyltransferase